MLHLKGYVRDNGNSACVDKILAMLLFYLLTAVVAEVFKYQGYKGVTRTVTNVCFNAHICSNVVCC